MFHSNSQALVQLPGNPAPGDEAQLPRGECGFILSESDTGNGPRQRCSCRSFYPDSVVRSRCGCGHQAWNHEAQPLGTVSMEEYVQAIEQMKRLRQEIKRFETLEQHLKQELFKERIAREELVKTNQAVQARFYQNMQHLKILMDDKVEAVVDRTTELSDQLKAQGERLTMVDEFSMELENRVDRVEQLSGMSRDVTPAASTPKARLSTPNAPPLPQLPLLMQPQHTLGQLPIRTDKKYPLSWSVRVIFVPRKSQRFAYDHDSTGYRRCASRKLQQNLDFPSQDSSCFANRIETAFKGVFRGRPWMPITGHRPADEPFGRMALTLLPPDLIHRDIWDYPFLEDHCIAHDKMQGDILYITLQYEDVTWNEIRFLPAVTGGDESCWNHDEELDSTAEYKSLDSEIMYDYQDPPPTYSSRTHSMADRAPSKLDVLADSAAMLSPIERAQTASSSHSARLSPLQRTPTQSSSHSSNPRFSSERSSLRSFETETTDDEHRDKKPKLRSKQSMPTINGSGHAQQPMYVSGRSKRKMPVREKGLKEPLHFNVTNVAKWRPNLLHPHSSKGKEAAQNQ
ncbi:Nn.00g026040.m01.CDS01 [Neocucurbitaria sp. VM-36]